MFMYLDSVKLLLLCRYKSIRLLFGVLIKTIFNVLITQNVLINYIRNVVYTFYVGDFIFLSILFVMLFIPLPLYSLINIY